MKCPKCQKENAETRKFCRECGAKLAQVCPKCNSENLLDDKFCGQCGHSLGEEKATSFADYSKPRSYIPKYLADKILSSRSSIEGERKVVTALFADVANYTAISEKLDPEDVHQIIDGCFKLLMDEIHKYEGTVDKFTGGGVLALFGALIASEYHAQHACYAAIAIQRALIEYSEKVKKDCALEFKMRIGLNSGPVIVGSIGNDLIMDYTAIGDTINLASRMETMAQPGTILVSGDTYKMTRDFFKFKPLGKLEVKGKEGQLEAYELLEAGEIQTRFEAAMTKGLTRFVGRAKETRALKEAFEKTQSGHGQVIGIVGEAGVGKSRLLLELRRMLSQEHYTYLEGRCLHFGGSMPYLPILDVLRLYFDIKEGEREFVIKKNVKEKIMQLDEKLKDILPPLYEILSLKVEDEGYLNLQPPQRRERTFEAIRDLLVRESQNKPLILAVEDLHWIDKTSEEFLTYLIDWLPNAHILMILLYRPEYTHAWGDKSYYSHVGVGQLSSKASAELVQSILEEAEVVPELRELIISKAGGNPLFVEEFTYTLLENGSIKKKDRHYVLSGKASDIQVPDTIQGIITARMDRLEDNLKRTMQVAAVIGRDFAYRILYTITGMQEDLKSYLLNLQGLELIYEKSLFPELEYIFKHAITQEVAYNSLLLNRRKEIHEKIGQAIEQLYGERLEEFYEMLAHHYSRSGNLEKAYQYLKHSAEKASRSYSNWEAFRYYKETINILNKMEDTEIHKRRALDIRLSMDGVMRLLGYPEDSLDILQQGEKLAKELGDNRSLATLYSGMGLCYAFRGDSTRGLEYGGKCFDQAEKAQDLDLMAKSAFDLCSSYAIRGEYLKTIVVAPRVIELLEKTHRETEFFGGPYNFNLYSALTAYYGHAIGILGHFKDGEAICEKGLHHALANDDVYTLGFVEVLYGFLFFLKGDAKGAASHAQKASKCSDNTQVAPMLAMALFLTGWAYYMEGDLKAALEAAESGIRIQRDAGIPFLLSFHYSTINQVYFDLGDWDRAFMNAEEALRLAAANGEKFLEGYASILLGRTLAKRDTNLYQTAETNILHGIDILNEIGVKSLQCLGYLYLGELYADMNHKERAIENVNKAKGMFQEMEMGYWLRRTQEVLEKL